MNIKVESHVDDVLDELKKRIDKALTLCGESAEGYAKLNLTDKDAVVTGLLRNSITYELSGRATHISSYKADKGSKTGKYSGALGDKDDDAVYIGTNVEYAPYIEFGTGRNAAPGVGGQQTFEGIKPMPYLKPALADHKEEYARIIKDVLEGKL